MRMRRRAFCAGSVPSLARAAVGSRLLGSGFPRDLANLQQGLSADLIAPPCSFWNRHERLLFMYSRALHTVGTLGAGATPARALGGEEGAQMR